MKVTVSDALFEKIPGLCVGVIAVRGMDNRAGNVEAEAFRRRCCTEINLLLKLNPKTGEDDVKKYKAATAEAGISAPTAIEDVFTEYKKILGVTEPEEEEEIEILNQPKQATLDELIGSDVLPRVNPALDMVRAAMLKFHTDMYAYDLPRRKSELVIEADRSDNYGDDGTVTEDTENLVVLIYGFATNRKNVAAARNETARRMKAAFDCAVETGWLEGNTHSFETEI